MGVGGCYDQSCCPASPKFLLGLDLGLGLDNTHQEVISLRNIGNQSFLHQTLYLQKKIEIELHH